MFHFSHCVKVGKFGSIVIVSPDTDDFVCSIHNYRQLVYFDLHQVWFIKDKTASRIIIPVHKTIDVVEPDVFEILPAAHAFIGCDSTSKVGSKGADLKMAKDCGLELLSSFGRSELTNHMIGDAERFLVRCISQKHNTDRFDDLLYEITRISFNSIWRNSHLQAIV